jgi:hypothetical protein
VIELVNNLQRLDYMLCMYLKPFLIRQTEPPKLTLYFQDRFDWAPGLGKFPVDTVDLIDSYVSGTQAFAFNQGRIWKSTNAMASVWKASYAPVDAAAGSSAIAVKRVQTALKKAMRVPALRLFNGT